MKKQKDLLIILIPLLILTILWVIFNVYHNYVTSTIKDPLTVQIIPIEGNFDNKTIEQIRNRIRIEPAFEIISIDSESTSPTPTPTIDSQQGSGTNSARITPLPTTDEDL